MNGSASNPDYFHKLSATLDAMADPDPYCKALTQDPHTKKHTGPRCSRRKIHDDTKSQQSKTIQDLVDDELCNQHKLMRERFMHIVVPQLHLPRHLLVSQKSTSTSGIATPNSTSVMSPSTTTSAPSVHTILRQSSAGANSQQQLPVWSGHKGPSSNPIAPIRNNIYPIINAYDAGRESHIDPRISTSFAGNASTNTHQSKKGEAPILHTRTRTRLPHGVSNTNSGASIVKRCMTLIIAHNASVTRGETFEAVAAKALKLKELTKEMNKLIDLMSGELGNVDDEPEAVIYERNERSCTLKEEYEEDWSTAWT